MFSHKKKLLAAVIFCISSLAAALPSAQSLESPVGYWKTIDDVSGQPKSIIQIWKSADQSLTGKVVRIFPKLGENVKNKLCTACQGVLHNQPIVGMVILSELKPIQKAWKNGKILDPSNGKTYQCSAQLTENGSKLKVRGYIGVPILGRSQTWERVDLLSG